MANTTHFNEKTVNTKPIIIIIIIIIADNGTYD